MDGSQANSHKQRNKHMEITSSLGLLGKAYSMTLVVIVGDYSAFVSKASLRRINETNI